MTVRSSTDLPPPDAPTTPRISPRRTSSERWSSTICVAEADHEVAHLDRRLVASGASIGDHIPIEAKKMANTPSSTMTRKIDFTTEAVVCSAERFGAALDAQAFAAGDDADRRAP